MGKLIMNRVLPFSRAAIVLLVLSAWVSSPSWADTPSSKEGTQTLESLGRLNGQTLACKQPALSARIRDVVINFVPKERAMGEVFEQATSAAFLKQGTAALPCPDVKTLVEQINELEKQLKISFSKNP